MSPALRARLEELIAQYARSSVHWERSLASRFGAVPLYADDAGCILLAANGDWIYVYGNQDWVATVEYSRDVTDDLKAIAIQSAAQKHPELRALLP